jgi:hypothetical protein
VDLCSPPVSRDVNDNVYLLRFHSPRRLLGRVGGHNRTGDEGNVSQGPVVHLVRRATDSRCRNLPAAIGPRGETTWVPTATRQDARERQTEVPAESTYRLYSVWWARCGLPWSFDHAAAGISVPPLGVFLQVPHQSSIPIPDPSSDNLRQVNITASKRKTVCAGRLRASHL